MENMFRAVEQHETGELGRGRTHVQLEHRRSGTQQTIQSDYRSSRLTSLTS
jgi:hypothetical protein